jgi:hypothetical protein
MEGGQQANRASLVDFLTSALGVASRQDADRAPPLQFS